MALVDQILKAASEFQDAAYKERRRIDLTTVLPTLKGWDAIKSLLAQYGMDVGAEFAKNKHYIKKGSGILTKMYLLGNYDGCRIIPDSPPPPSSHVEINPAIYYSESAKYDREEDERENNQYNDI